MLDEREVLHITLGDEGDHPRGLDRRCCVTALCGTDLSEAAYSEGRDEILCPLCHTIEQEELA
jgi:hypothetical protein